MEKHNHLLRAQALKKIDVKVASQMFEITDEEAVSFILKSGADGREIRAIREDDKKWKSRKNAAEEYFSNQS